MKRTCDKKKWEFDIKFGVFKFKEIRERLESFSLEKSKNFMQQELTKWRKISNRNLLKRSDLLWKRRHAQKISRKYSMKSSNALYFRILPRSLLKPDPNLKTKHIQTQIWKTCMFKNVQMTSKQRKLVED